MCRFVRGEDNRPLIASTTATQVRGSLMTFVCANGERILDVICMKSKFDKDGFVEAEVRLPAAPTRDNQRGVVKLIYCFSKSGLFDGEQISMILLEHFAPLWAARRGLSAGVSDSSTLRCHLFLDNLAQHKDKLLMLKLMLKNIFMFALPLNTSHFTQPLDAECFASFKKMLAEIYVADAFAHAVVESNCNSILIGAAHKALKYISPATIKKSFLTTNLSPFNARLFRERAVQQCQQRLALGISLRPYAQVRAIGDMIIQIKGAQTIAVAKDMSNSMHIRTHGKRITSTDIVLSLIHI